jgi:hypothetical protein
VVRISIWYDAGNRECPPDSDVEVEAECDCPLTESQIESIIQKKNEEAKEEMRREAMENSPPQSEEEIQKEHEEYGEYLDRCERDEERIRKKEVRF